MMEDRVNQLKHHSFKNAAIVLAGTQAAREFFEPIFFERSHELAIVAFCDTRLHLVDLLSFPGSEQSAEVSVHDIVRHAIDCAGILLAHNHPKGSPHPSDADINLTKRLCVVAEAIDVAFLDHLIFAGERMVSCRQIGLV